MENREQKKHVAGKDLTKSATTQGCREYQSRGLVDSVVSKVTLDL